MKPPPFDLDRLLCAALVWWPVVLVLVFAAECVWRWARGPDEPDEPSD